MPLQLILILIISAIVVMASALYVLLSYRHKQHRLQLLWNEPARYCQWAMVVFDPGDRRILYMQGLKPYIEKSSKLQGIGSLATYMQEDDSAAFRTFIGEYSASSSHDSLIVRFKQQHVMECVLCPLKWKDVDKHMLMLRPVSKAYRKMQMAGKENALLKDQMYWCSHLINYLPYPTWIRASDFSIKYCNVTYMEMMAEDAAPGDAGGMPELFSEAIALAQESRNEKIPCSTRQRLMVHDEIRLYEVVEIYVKEEDVTVGYAHDISRLSEAEISSENSLTTLEDLLGTSSSAMSIYNPDTRITFYNKAFTHIWGLDAEWLDTHPTFAEILERLRVLRKLPEQINFPAFKEQRLKLFNDVTEPYEDLFYLPDGRVLRNVAIPHSSGGLLFIYEDVSSRFELEQSYNTLIAVQRETLDNLNEGVVVFAENGKLQLKNPMFLSLWELDDADAPEGIHIASLLEKMRRLYQDQQWTETKKAFIARTQVRQHSSARIERNDGAMLDCNIVPLPDGGVLIIYIDVTATTLLERSLRERNEALEASDRLKTDFLTNMSYELRSPLMSISGFAEMLRDNYLGQLNDGQQEYVEGIYQSSKHLTHLIDDILDLSTVEAGYMELTMSSFPINQMLRAMLALLGDRLQECYLTGYVECDEQIGMIYADEIRIRQILFHLLNNAVKYSRKGGHIILGAKREKGGVLLFVSDNGIGIAESEQENVFGKFYRGKLAAKTSGTGLGLSMVKNFVELHGGHVTLESTPEEGTIVSCFIPDES